MGCFQSKAEPAGVDFSGLGPGWALLAESMAGKSPRERATYMALLAQVAAQRSKHEHIRSLPASLSPEQSYGGSWSLVHAHNDSPSRCRPSSTQRATGSHDIAMPSKGGPVSAVAAATDHDDSCTSEDASHSTTPLHSDNALAGTRPQVRPMRPPDQLPHCDSFTPPARRSASTHFEGGRAAPVRQQSKLSITSRNSAAMRHSNQSNQSKAPASWEHQAVDTDGTGLNRRTVPRSQPGYMEEGAEHTSAPTGVRAAASSKQKRHDAVLLCKPMLSEPPAGVQHANSVPAAHSKPSEISVSPLGSPTSSVMSPTARHVKWAPLPHGVPCHTSGAPAILTASYPEGFTRIQDGAVPAELHGLLGNGIDDYHLRRCATEHEGLRSGMMLQPGNYAISWQPCVVPATPSGRLMHTASVNSLRHSMTSSLEDTYHQMASSPRGSLMNGLYMMYGAHLASQMQQQQQQGRGSINGLHDPALAPPRANGPAWHINTLGVQYAASAQLPHLQPPPLSPLQRTGAVMHEQTHYRQEALLHKQMGGVPEQAHLRAGMRLHHAAPRPSASQLSVQPLLQARLREQQQQQLEAQMRQRQQQQQGVSSRQTPA